MIMESGLVAPLMNPKFAVGLAARVCELRVRGTRTQTGSQAETQGPCWFSSRPAHVPEKACPRLDRGWEPVMCLLRNQAKLTRSRLHPPVVGVFRARRDLSCKILSSVASALSDDKRLGIVYAYGREAKMDRSIRRFATRSKSWEENPLKGAQARRPAAKQNRRPAQGHQSIGHRAGQRPCSFFPIPTKSPVETGPSQWEEMPRSGQVLCYPSRTGVERGNRPSPPDSWAAVVGRPQERRPSLPSRVPLRHQGSRPNSVPSWSRVTRR
jgi:hypothetical protein